MSDSNDHDLEAWGERLGQLMDADAARSEVPPELKAELDRLTVTYEPDDSKAWIFFGVFMVLAVGVAGFALWTPLLLVGGFGAVALGIAVDRRLRRLEGRSLVDAVRGALGA